MSVKPVLSWLANATKSDFPTGKDSSWSEKFLARVSLRACDEVTAGAVSQEEGIAIALAAFRLWMRYGELTLGRPLTSGGSGQIEGGMSRRFVLKAYYDLLSEILQQGLLYPDAKAGALEVNANSRNGNSSLSPKAQQAAELRRVEAIYENVLLKETRFPKASESNAEIEDWVHQVMLNWQIFYGSGWVDDELGEGGQNAYGRNVLDVSF